MALLIRNPDRRLDLTDWRARRWYWVNPVTGERLGEAPGEWDPATDIAPMFRQDALSGPWYPLPNTEAVEYRRQLAEALAWRGEYVRPLDPRAKQALESFASPEPVRMAPASRVPAETSRDEVGMTKHLPRRKAHP